MDQKRPRVLFVYYTFTNQTRMVVDAMVEELTARGCDVTKSALAFSDARYGGRFSKLPMRRSIWHIVGMLVPQRRRKTGEIVIPPEAQAGDYALVVFGSPTWWLTTCMPVRSYLHSSAAKVVLSGKPFAAVSVSSYQGKPRRHQEAGRAGRRNVGGRHAVRLGREPGHVDGVVAPVHAQEQAEVALPRHPTAATEPQGRLLRAREELRAAVDRRGLHG